MLVDDIGTRFCSGDRFVCDASRSGKDPMNGRLGHIRLLPIAECFRATRHDRGESGSVGVGAPVALIEIDCTERQRHNRHLLDCLWGHANTFHQVQGWNYETFSVVIDDWIDRSWLYVAITIAWVQIILVGAQARYSRVVATLTKVDDRHTAYDVLLLRLNPFCESGAA